MLRADVTKNPLAIFYIDLDHFKEINDQYGHAIGDEVLIKMVALIRKCVRDRDIVARLGGDEFTVILEDIENPDILNHVAKRLCRAIAQPFKIQDRVINTGASVGVSLYPSQGKDMETLLKNADAAMYHAKKGGRNQFCFSSDLMITEH